MAVKIPAALNNLWSAAERNPAGAVAVVVLVVVVAVASWSVAHWEFGLAFVSLVVGVAIGRSSKGGPR